MQKGFYKMMPHIMLNAVLHSLSQLHKCIFFHYYVKHILSDNLIPYTHNRHNFEIQFSFHFVDEKLIKFSHINVNINFQF